MDKFLVIYFHLFNIVPLVVWLGYGYIQSFYQVGIHILQIRCRIYRHIVCMHCHRLAFEVEDKRKGKRMTRRVDRCISRTKKRERVKAPFLSVPIPTYYYICLTSKVKGITHD